MRVCLTTTAAAKVKAIIAQNALVPQISSNPFDGLSPNDIVSVDILDLLEQPDVHLLIKKYLADLAARTKAKPNYLDGINKNNESLKMVVAPLETIISTLEKISSPEWNSDSTEIPRHMFDVSANYPWTPSPSGLRFTNDFDPRITIPDNCVFSQAVRQSAFGALYATLDFDNLLVSKMSDDDRITLGVHEAVYNVVMNAPNYDHVVNPSYLTRKLTMLCLAMAAGHVNENEPVFAAIIKNLGYGKFVYLKSAVRK